jgi:hypothetical protein
MTNEKSFISAEPFDDNLYISFRDGLPRWHLEQRKQEYSRIDARL